MVNLKYGMTSGICVSLFDQMGENTYSGATGATCSTTGFRGVIHGNGSPGDDLVVGGAHSLNTS